ncbi:MAG: helix-turn-helix transcriptional regulator [Chloroflexi bacterium]|nr:helix-turn-helix transcriptional regulator [Chloroflexota bacterium]
MSRKEIRIKINELLEKRDMSTAEFVKKTGVAYNTALGLRRGVVTRIDLDVMARVCEVLGVQPGDLFELVEVTIK